MQMETHPQRDKENDGDGDAQGAVYVAQKCTYTVKSTPFGRGWTGWECVGFPKLVMTCVMRIGYTDKTATRTNDNKVAYG